MAMLARIFINYRRDDSTGAAGRLHDRLAQTFGRKNLFMDVDHIPAGVDFVNYLDFQVAQCDVFLAIIGTNWLYAKDESGGRRIDNPDDFVAIEIAKALARNIPVIPVLIDGARMPKAAELPEALRPFVRRHALEVRHSQFGRDADALVAKVRAALGDKGAGLSRSRLWMVTSVATLAMLLLIGWSGYAFVQNIFPQTERQAELRWEGLKTTPAIPIHDRSGVYWPWTKFCEKTEPQGRRICRTFKEVRSESGQFLASAALFEQQGEEKKLRVTFPATTNVEGDVDLQIDSEPPIQSPVSPCQTNGCIADFDANAELMASLKRGANLSIAGRSSQGEVTRYILYLTNFADANEGLPSDPRRFEADQKNFVEALRKKQSGKR